MTVSFRAKLLASHAAIALAAGAVTLVVVERSVSERMEAQVDTRLEAQANAVANWLERARHPDRLASRLAGVVGARVTILDSSDVAVGDSEEEYQGTSAERRSAEVSAAKGGGVGRETRFSDSEGQMVRYVAVPAPDQSVVRLGLPIGEIDETKAELRRQLGVGGLASLLVAFGLAALVAGPLTRRLRDATAMAERIRAGDYAVEASAESGDEFSVLSNTLAAAAVELRETEARRREFLATVAHEIRTPVTSIRGYAQMLVGSTVEPAEREEFASTIHRNAVRISKLVEDLLELEALQAGQGPDLRVRDVSLATVASNVIETLRAPTEEQEVSLTSEIADDLIARGDTDAVERVVLNLVDNALRHGGPGVSVVIDAHSVAGGKVVVSVRDDGRGIPAEHRERIFERFQRGSAANDSERRGSGLGLAIARELAQSMGGTLTLVDSDAGASFELELPG